MREFNAPNQSQPACSWHAEIILILQVTAFMGLPIRQFSLTGMAVRCQHGPSTYYAEDLTSITSGLSTKMALLQLQHLADPGGVRAAPLWNSLQQSFAVRAAPMQDCLPVKVASEFR